MRSSTRLLVGLYCRRFLDNDLVSPEGGTQAGVALAVALLAAPGVFNLAWLLFTYSGPFITPSERLLLALDHKYQFLACSMIVTALGAAVEWDALSVDARDAAILGPLPVGAATMWRAKLVALVVFLSVFAAAVNAVPTFGFPVVWLSLMPIGFVRAASVVAVHGLTSIAAAVFGFCAVVSLRSALAASCGARVFRAVSPVVQFALVLGLIAAFLLLPGYSSDMRSRLRASPASLYLSPPLWFVGAYDRLTTRALYADPDLSRDSTWRFWERERIVHTYPVLRIPGRLPEGWVHPSPLFRTEAEARRKYLELQPALGTLAGRAAVALPLAVLSATLLYFLAYLRCGRRLRETEASHLLLPARARRWVSAHAGLLVTRRASERATFFYTLQGLFRSRPHLMRIAGFVAIGAAVAVSALLRAMALNRLARVSPTPVLLSLQLILLFFLIVGLRSALRVPAALDANWVWRLASGRDAEGMLAGVRRSVVAGAVLPLLVCLFPVHAACWGLRVAAFHLLAGLLASLLLTELLFAGFRKVPFTCPHVPGNARLRYVWPFYVLGFVAFTSGLAAIEGKALESATGPAWFVAGMIVAVVVAGLVRRHVMRRDARLVFDEQPEPAVQTLGLAD